MNVFSTLRGFFRNLIVHLLQSNRVSSYFGELLLRLVELFLQLLVVANQFLGVFHHFGVFLVLSGNDIDNRRINSKWTAFITISILIIILVISNF